MYKCINCGSHFEEPIKTPTTQAVLFGIEGMPTDQTVNVNVCPFCNSDEIMEVNE